MGDQFVGFFGLIIGILGLVLAITWLIFPFLGLSRFDKLLKVHTRFAPQLYSANAAQSEIAKALQWMVDNWKIGNASSPHPPPPPPV